MDKENIIKAWLQSEGRTARWLAGKVGISESHLSRITTGSITPSKPLALALENITNGGVPAVAWGAE